ncbi:MAG: hypothetical protein R3D44_04315 [Hyphomicrobiaceae bacterium]
MATILEFRASDAGTKRSRHRSGGSAEIVIFPGIRYERWLERDGSQDARSAGPVRDVLKLVD